MIILIKNINCKSDPVVKLKKLQSKVTTGLSCNFSQYLKLSIHIKLKTAMVNGKLR